jgi:hypothetical protein
MHVYCQNLETQEVWDFSKEDYVDRLLQNQADGKLIAHQQQSRDQKQLSSMQMWNKKM